MRGTVKVITLILIGVLLGATSAAVWAEDPIRLFVNGVEVQSDVPPQVINGRTMIPARALAEALGAKVEWDASQRAVMVTALKAGGNPTDLPSSNSSNSSISNEPVNSLPSDVNNINFGDNSIPQNSPASDVDNINFGDNSSSSSSGPQNSPGITASWTGTWASNYGDIVLIQTGDSVTGTYPHRSGRLVGTVENNVLHATWSEAPTYLPLNDLGEAVFTMSADGQSFTGVWRYGASGSFQEGWNGTRK